MPATVQRSFAGGEIDQTLETRQDVARVASGVRAMRNGWSTRSGAFQNRPGTRYVSRTKEQVATTRKRAFFFNTSQAYSIEVGEGYLRLIREASNLFSDETVEGVGDDDVVTQTLYLGSGDDDLPALSGGAPSVGPPDASEGLLEKRLRSSEGAASSRQTSGPFGGGPLGVHCYSSLAGNPGSALAWITGTHTLKVKILGLTSVSTAFLRPRLHRVSDAGVGQERCDAGGASPGDPSSVTLPSGTPGTITGSGVDLIAEGAGVYTFVWTDAVWAGPFADGDRIMVELAFTSNKTASPGTITYELNTADSSFTTTITAGTQAGLPWEAGTENVPGDLVFTDAVLEYGWKWWLSDEAADPTPTGTSGQSEDAPFNSLLSTKPTTQAAIAFDAAAMSSETMFFVTRAGEPGWSTWPVSSVQVSLVFDNISGGGGALNVSLRMQKFTADNVAGGNTGAESNVVDLVASGAGPHTFTVPVPASWTSPSATDRFVLRLRYENLGGSAASAEVLAGHEDSWVLAAAQFEAGRSFFYCCATNTNKDPSLANYLDDFWYRQPDDEDGRPIFEIPTPYAAAHLDKLDFQQSGDLIAITHREYPPHELIRQGSDVLGVGHWTMLPTPFKPRATAPTGLAFTANGDSGGDKTIRYKVTAIQRDTKAESSPGALATTTTSPIDDDSCLGDEDLLVLETAHGLETGDEIALVEVSTVDPDRGNENAIIELEGRVVTITKVDDDSFRLDGTGGKLTFPVLTAEGDWPSIQVTWGKAFLERVSVYVPKGDGARRIAFEWDPVADAERYYVYREIKGEEGWGLLGDTTAPEFADEGDTDDSTGQAIKLKARVDEEITPPNYSSPFRRYNWPRASAYHGGRQWFAGTEDNPLRVWGSVVGDFRNFSTRTPLQDDDAVDFTLTAVGANEIHWLASLGAILVIGTTGGVVAAGGTQGRLVPTEVPNLETLTYEGAAHVPPVVVDQALLYVQERGSIIREMGFNLGEGGLGGYQGRDLTAFSRHLFDGYSITQLARAATPQPIIAALRDDGTLLGLTYMPEQDVAGWHRHDTEGSFLSVVRVPEGSADVFYVLVERQIDGQTVYYNERLDERIIGRAGTDVRRDAYFVDAGLSYDGTNASDTTLELSGGTTWAAGEPGLTLTASEDLFEAGDVDNGFRLIGADGEEAEVLVTAYVSPTEVTVELLTAAPASTRDTALATWVAMVDEVSGLGHLEGASVSVLADGVVLGPFVVSGGALPAFDRPYGFIHVGLPYVADLEPLDLDFVVDDDSSLDKSKRIPSVCLIVEDTRGVTAGIDADGLRSMPAAHGDTATGLVTDKRTITFPSHHNRSGRTLVRQSQPLPVTITALLRHWEVGERV